MTFRVMLDWRDGRGWIWRNNAEYNTERAASQVATRVRNAHGNVCKVKVQENVKGKWKDL